MKNYNYPNIDMQRTGALLKKKVEEARYTVRELPRMYFYLRRIQQVA